MAVAEVDITIVYDHTAGNKSQKPLPKPSRVTEAADKMALLPLQLQRL